MAQENYEWQFDTITVKHGYEFKNNQRLYLSYQFIYPTNETFPIERIKEQVIREFFEYEEKDTVLNLLDVAKKGFETGIKDEVSEYIEIEKGSYTSRNYNERYSAIRIVNNKVLVYMIQDYWYAGGSHGLEPSSATNYDLQTGNKITIDDLFTEQSKTKILELIKREIDITPQSDISVTENFMMLPKGIKFCFNPYQIASYSEGRIDATLKYSEFKHLLKPDAVHYFHE